MQVSKCTSLVSRASAAPPDNRKGLVTRIYTFGEIIMRSIYCVHDCGCPLIVWAAAMHAPCTYIFLPNHTHFYLLAVGPRAIYSHTTATFTTACQMHLVPNSWNQSCCQFDKVGTTLISSLQELIIAFQDHHTYVSPDPSDFPEGLAQDYLVDVPRLMQ